MIAPETISQFAQIVPVETDEDVALLNETLSAHTMFSEDWSNRRSLWDKNEPATEMQLAYLLDLGYSGTTRLTKIAAAYLIDRYVVARDYLMRRNSLIERRRREALREQERAEKAERKRAEKIERMNNTPPRTRVARSTLIKWMYEFEMLWNVILADGVITLEEAEELKAWLNAHRTVANMHTDFIAAIDRAVQDGVITGDESNALYDGAIALIESLGGKAADSD